MALEEQIKQSYSALKEYFSPSKRHQSSGNPAQLIVFAEHAVKNGCREVALDCIKLYFTLSAPVNQFHVRAHFCEALASAPSHPSHEEQLAHSLCCILKAVVIAKKSECYHFLLYNASVLLWQICRPFHQPGSRRKYVKQLTVVLKALEDTKEKDIPWRLELMIGLVLCQLDAGQSDEAIKTCTSAIKLARKKAPEKFRELMRIYVRYNLGDSKVFDRDCKSHPEYSVLIRLYKIKSAIVVQKLSGSELEQRLGKLLAFIRVGNEQPSSGRKTAALSSTPAPPLEEKPLLLLELGSLSFECGLKQLAKDCLDELPQDTVGQPIQWCIRQQVLNCQVDLKEGYNKTVVEGRVQTVNRLEDILTSALRTNDMDLVQHVCVVLWNTSLPLLQPNLRHHLRKPLSATAAALEQINSLLCPMRINIHFELGKIYADQGHLEASLEHLDKAYGLDCFEEYREQISVVQNKVTLRAQLYTTPEEPLQKAIKIIEQTNSSTGGGDELRSLLANAGEFLAPSQFSQTLSRPSAVSVHSIVSQVNAPSELSGEIRDIVEEKGKKLAGYSLAKEVVGEHLKSMDKIEDRQRCRVWSDLARAARKQGVWDVAASAARFCVAYDDGRWSGSVTKPKSIISERQSSPRYVQGGSIPHQNSSSLLQKCDSQLAVTKGRLSLDDVSGVGCVEALRRDECDLVRTLANTHCLLAECLVFYLQQEGLQLEEKPPSLNVPSFTEPWSSYRTWCSQVSSDSIGGFLRAGELGTTLGEEVVVGNAAVYLWNYHLHWVKSGQLTEVVGAFKPLLVSMKQVKMSSDTVLLTRVSASLVGGLVQKWSPKGTETPRTAKKGSRAESRGPKKSKTGDDQLVVDPESGAELKEAFEVCEYCAGVWSSSVPMSTRGELLSGWVACRQLLRQPFTSNKFGIDEADDPFVAHCRAMIAVKLLGVQGNKIWDFPSPPSLSEVASMVSGCDWDEVLVEMELWVCLAELALKQKDHSMAYQSTCKAVALKLPELASEKLSSDQRMGCELQSLAYSLQGQTLSTSAASNVSVVRKALEAFHNAIRSGHRASSYSLVFDGCRHYWQICRPLTTDPMEREYLREPLYELLELCVPLLGGRHGAKSQDQLLPNKRKDYELVSQMYSTVFQGYIDKCCWEEGLTLVEEALWNTPKPIHPHLVPYKLVFKSRMGKSVEGDFIRIQDEPSDFVASLWYKTATNSSDPTQTITAYQKAIDTLQDGNSWQKIEYLLELCEWLYTHHFPITDPIDQLEKVTEILLSTCDEQQSSSVVGGVRQLEVLMRVHVMMALLHGRGSSEHTHLCLVTVGLCMDLWKMLVEGTSGLPTSVLEWSTYSPSSQLLEQLRAASGDKALNKDTVPKPMLTLHYLSELVEALLFSGLHTLAFPVVHLQMVIAETLVEKSKPLCQLYRMRLSWLCSELRLSVTHTTLTLPDPEDLASSRIEIEQYRAKKAAVEKGSKDRASSKPKTTPAGVSKPSVGVQRRCVEERVVLREVWVDMARLLIQQGEYQLARDLLNQAMLSSQTFEDERTLYIIHVLSAKLALFESDQQKAIKLVTQAQKYPADLSDWLEGILLLSEAINSSSAYKRQLKPVLKHATSKLDQLLSSHKNNSSRLKYAIETINIRLVLCELGDSIQEASGTEHSIRALSDKLTESAKTLMDLGYSRDAAHTNTQHASFIRSFAQSKLAGIDNRFQTWMLGAISLCDKAVNALQSVYEHTQTICQPSEGVSPPVQRELIGAQCLLAYLLLDAFSHHSAQCWETKVKTRDKSSVEKLIEEFVKEEPVLSLTQEEWQRTVQMALEKALVLLTSAHSLANANAILKTKVTVGLGRCLSLLSTYTKPDSALQWAPDYCIVKTENPVASDEGDSPKQEEKSCDTLSGPKYGALSSVMRKKEADEAESDEDTSLLYLTQATHMLVQAVSMCLSHSQLALGAQTALEIVDCCGGFDTTTSSLYLALYQSLSVSMEMSTLLKQVLTDPCFSKLGALLEQNHHLTSSQSPSLHNTQELKTFEAYKMLSVSENHLDLLRHFPHHFRFLVLQHSPDRSRLYASYLVPPQPPPPAPKKGQPPPTVEVLDPVITCADVSPEDLDGLLDMMSDFKSSHYQHLTKPNPLKNSCEELLKDVVAGTEAYLSQVMPLMVEAIRREKSDKDLSVVVLADTLLLRLPLEALELFQTRNVQSVTRDFSLQMLSHRLEKFSADESVPVTESSKDIKKKAEKYQPQPTTLLANTANFRYVLDPRKEIEGTDVCREIMHHIQQFSKLTSKWSGYSSGEQVMSISKWLSLFKESSGLIVFSPENLLAHLPPNNLTPLALQDCAIAVVMDRMHTTQSMLFQSKLDFHKSCFELKCERPVDTAILLSLVGVRCLLSNQWTNSVQNNLDTVLTVVKGLLSEGVSVGELNWSRIRSLLPSSEADNDEDIAPQSKTNLTDTNEECLKQEDESTQDKEPIDYTFLYNCVIYGLPHISLIATST